jgi:DNA-binding response OmpR family regulator
MKLLLVEDEDRIAAFLEKGFGANGYMVTRVATGEGALAAVAGDRPDLVVLDLGLPDLDGLQVLRRLRESRLDVPVIVLTARGTVGDRVKGLELGADDYLPKPFAFEELLARVRARLRSGGNGAATELQAGDLVLDLLTREARLGERPVVLTSREFSLMQEFLQHPHRTFSRRQLLATIWGIDFDPGSNLVDVYVGYLRRKLGMAAIETVRGTGYRLGVPDAGAARNHRGQDSPTAPPGTGADP